MLYVLECMALGILSMNSGYGVMYTTGKEPTWKEVGVCGLCWLTTSLIVLFIEYTITYFKGKKSSNSPKFSYGFLYLLECMGLVVLCIFYGIDRNMYTTGKKFTWKEVVFNLFGWFILAFIIVCIVLVCVF